MKIYQKCVFLILAFSCSSSFRSFHHNAFYKYPKNSNSLISTNLSKLNYISDKSLVNKIYFTF